MAQLKLTKLPNRVPQKLLSPSRGLARLEKQVTFEIGSIWRRWDPHVHTPDSILHDNYAGGWDPFLAAQEQAHAVQAIGITDYMSIANYRKLKALKDVGRLTNIALMFPNVEFRITPKTKEGRAINKSTNRMSAIGGYC